MHLCSALNSLPYPAPPINASSPRPRPLSRAAPQLSGLVRDAAWLESYCTSTLLIVKETLQASSDAPPPHCMGLVGHGLCAGVSRN